MVIRVDEGILRKSGMKGGILMDVRTLYTKIRNGSEHQVQEMQVIMESFLKQRSRSFSELNPKEKAERLISEANL